MKEYVQLNQKQWFSHPFRQIPSKKPFHRFSSHLEDDILLCPRLHPSFTYWLSFTMAEEHFTSCLPDLRLPSSCLIDRFSFFQFLSPQSPDSVAQAFACYFTYPQVQATLDVSSQQMREQCLTTCSFL